MTKDKSVKALASIIMQGSNIHLSMSKYCKMNLFNYVGGSGPNASYNSISVTFVALCNYELYYCC